MRAGRFGSVLNCRSQLRPQHELEGRGCGPNGSFKRRFQTSPRKEITVRFLRNGKVRAAFSIDLKKQVVTDKVVLDKRGNVTYLWQRGI